MDIFSPWVAACFGVDDTNECELLLLETENFISAEFSDVMEA